MRTTTATAFLAVLCLAPAVSYGQTKKAVEAERKIDVVLYEFNEEMRGYERELKYFQRVPESKPLLELRGQLVAQAAEVGKLEFDERSGPAIQTLSRGMAKAARKLDASTREFEKRAESVGNEKDRAVAGRMRSHSKSMVRTVGKLTAMFR